MADYLTTDTELTSVANAIRTKGGTSASLVYPAGFVSAIEAISTGTDVSDTTATAADVRTGKYFYTSAGTKTQGTIADQAAQTITPTTTDQTIASGKYLTGAQTIKGDANLIAGNIKKDVTIFGVTGIHEGGGGGNPEAEENDVIFIDYDGTIRYSYSASEFANLTALPANPTHQGLTAQGWNWTLSDAKTYVEANGALVIGQSYITADQKTRLYIEISNRNKLTIPIYWRQSVANGVSIDWGDGSAITKLSGTGNKTTTHTYASIGRYVITLDCTSGTMRLNGASAVFGDGTDTDDNVIYRNMLTKVELGKNIDGIRSSNFRNYCNLKTITIPNGVNLYYQNVFNGATSLQALVLPSVSSASFNTSTISSNDSLRYLSLPKGITSITSMDAMSSLIELDIPNNINSSFSFSNAKNLKKLIIPNTVTAIPNYMLQQSNIRSVTFPNSITSIGTFVFSYCNYLKEMHMKPTTPPTIYADTFTNLSTDYVIYVPSESLSTYQNASNWSNYASRMVGE